MEHNLLFFILSGLFVIGYLAIVLEHHWHVNKSGTALLIGALSWFIISLFNWGSPEIGIALSHETQEIFAIVVFLLAAMTIVEVLVHYRLFDWIQEKIMQRKISQTQLFWLLGAITFLVSAFLDNLTTTLIMIQIGRKIYRNKNNFLIFTANTIIAANAGGAASPIGDVTTIMLWLAGKFNAVQIMSLGILPAITTWIIPQALLTSQIKAHEEAESAFPGFEVNSGEKVKPFWGVIAIGLSAFFIPVFFNIIGLPPFLGLLLGLGVLWIFIDLNSKRATDETYAHGKLVKVVQRADLSTLKFFIGILLAVSALGHAGILFELNEFLFGPYPDMFRLAGGNVALGFLSSLFDNVPLVAAAIKMFSASVPTSIWVLLAVAAGTGGSMLVIGSAAGVAAMGQVPELTFGFYLRKATLPAALGFIGGISVWALQTFLMA